MPEIKIQHVVSCSSEDKNNPAENMLKPEGTHKWKCATPGEKSVSIVLQFEKASQVHSIDVGNEGSAFIEMLVGRSSATTDQDYQVLLVASNFMTPLEARNGTNRTSVRMFGLEKFNKTVAGEKWDRVKIVCTQPFNKTSTFGMSFVKFHSPGGPLEMEKKKTIGFFKMKNEEDEGPHTGSLFSHRTATPAKTESPGPVTGAAAMRAASRLAEESKPSMSRTPSYKTSPAASQSHDKPDQKPEIQKRESKPAPATQNREKRKHSSSDDEPRPPSRKHSTPARKASVDDDDGSQPPLRKRSTSLSSASSHSSFTNKPEQKPQLKRMQSVPPKESPTKVFRRLMEGVVFVLSGFQNPYRAELRDRAVGMGATYKPDWGKGCTHLVCAFPNTPKYNQVSGTGKIVSKKWVHDCYKQKKLLPWRHYRLGDADSPSESSEDEEIITKKPKKIMSKSPSVTPKKVSPVKQSKPVDEDNDNVYGGDTDSGEDTEEEVRRIKAGITKNGKGKSPAKKTSPVKPANPDDDLYGAATDEDEPKPSVSKTVAMETDDGSDSGLPDLPDFFTDKKFFFYGKLDAKERRILMRYITAYDGEVEEYMGDTINYVVTSSPWDDNFDKALADNAGLVFVKPKWIHVCHDRSKLMPHQPYIVVPE